MPACTSINYTANALLITPKVEKKLHLQTYRRDISECRLLRRFIGKILINKSRNKDFFLLEFNSCTTCEIPEVKPSGSLNFTIYNSNFKQYEAKLLREEILKFNYTAQTYSLHKKNPIFELIWSNIALNDKKAIRIGSILLTQ